ncbi:ATP-binding cassette domain-containing protein [Streptomyces sp. NPDC007162]|uniref:ABC transporter ATP-binding protein n=1 Tax=Streptomyces sp. NPDC007162 TaxID=3156917 RepID=UPI0033E8BE8D
MIEAFGLTSDPRKAHPPAVDDVTFEARAGHVTALLGEAGAGKTTTLRLMLELQHGRGLTQFRGRPLHRIAHPSREVGVLLGDVPGHPGRSVRGHLRMLCAATGVPARRADEVLEAVGIVSLRDERLGTLSRGMDRRLGLACALLPDPHTLVLDEPTKGLAGREAHWLHRMLRAYAEQGGTVLFTTAEPKEAARAADRVVTLDAGRLVADQEATEFARTRLRPRVAVRSPHAARLAALLSKEARTARRSLEIVREGGNRLSVYGSTTAEVGETAFRHGILVHQLADETGDMGPGADAEPLTGPAPGVVRRLRDVSEPGATEESRAAGKAMTDDSRHDPGGELRRAVGSPVTPQPRASAAPKTAARSRVDDNEPGPSGSSDEDEPSVMAAHRSPASAEALSGGPVAKTRSPHADTSGLARPAEASTVALKAQQVAASAGPRPPTGTASAHRPSPAVPPAPTARTTSTDPASAGVPSQPPAATPPAQPPVAATPVRLSTAPASAQPAATPSAHRPAATADRPTASDPSPHQPTAAAAVDQPSNSAGSVRRSTPAATAQPSASAVSATTSQPREVSAQSPTSAEPGESFALASSHPLPRAVPDKAPNPADEPLQQPQSGKPTTAADADAVPAPSPADPARRGEIAVPSTAGPAHPAEAAARDILSPLPPAISVRSAPSPLRPLRYELRRAAGIGAGFVTCGAVLLLSAFTSVLLARLGHTPQARLFAAWPQELPLPPAALGAGLLGALAFGDEFRHPALAADRGTVPRRLGLLTAKLLVSGATAALLAFLTLGCDAEALYLVYGRELAKVPGDWLSLTVSWFGLVVGCSWAGVLAAGVFRSTTAGLAAVLAVPVLIVPAVHQALQGSGARMAGGLPARLREAFLLQWPFGGERYLVGVVRALAQPVGGALALSLSALLGAYLFTTLRARVR